MQLFPVGKVYDFMGKRGALAWLSVLMVLGSVFLLFEPGPKLGTDFKGGTEIEVAFDAPVGDREIRSAVTASGFSSPDVIRVEDDTNPHRFLIRVQEVSNIDAAMQAEVEKAMCYTEGPECTKERESTEVKVSPGGDKITVRFRSDPDLAWVKERLSTIDGLALRDAPNNPLLQNARDHKVEILLKSKGDQLFDGLVKELGDERVPDAALRVEWVGPKAGALLRDAALKSIAIALVFIMVYIAFRFDLRFSPGAVVALAHDALVTIGVLTLLQKELSLSTVAALLTIVGYSVNDTVVVYDRVRENLGLLRGSSFLRIINTSLSEMLSRTILTSGTTIVSMLAFFSWGTGTLKEFSLTLIIGMILGTYSSMYVALPLTHWLDRRFFSHFARQPTKIAAPRKKKATAVI